MAPLHAILATFGTDGDIIPYAGLGAALVRRGHRVTLAAGERYAALAARCGLAFRPLVYEAETDPLFANPDFWHPLKGATLSARWGAGLIGRQYDLLAELARDGETVFAASAAIFAARLVREKLGRPLATMILQPWMIASISAPPVMPAGLTLPRWAPRPLGRLYYRLIDVVGDRLVGARLYRVRAGLGLRPVRRIFRWWYSPDLVVGLFPDWYGPPQADWPPQVRLAGFPLFDGGSGAGLDPGVRDWCREPTVAFTFGTGMMHAAGLFRAAADACQRLGVRGLFLTRYRDQLPDPLPGWVRHCEFAPFRELFPLCAAVAHHGGVGTTAKALAAGTPQLVLSLAWDQRDNATRVRRLGAGEWLPARKADGPRIAAALAGVMTPACREKCRGLAARFGADDALETAAGWIEGLAHRGK